MMGDDGKGGLKERREPARLVAARAGAANPDGGDEIPAGGGRLRPGEARHRAQERLHRMQGRQIDGKSARAELAVALGVLKGGQTQHLDAVEFLALGLAEPVETVHQPSVGGEDVAVRDHVVELAAVAEDTDQEVMLAGLGAGQQAEAADAQSAKAHPVLPRQLVPRGLAFVPMQDDGVVGSALHVVSILSCPGPKRMLIMVANVKSSSRASSELCGFVNRVRLRPMAIVFAAIFCELARSGIDLKNYRDEPQWKTQLLQGFWSGHTGCTPSAWCCLRSSSSFSGSSISRAFFKDGRAVQKSVVISS